MAKKGSGLVGGRVFANKAYGSVTQTGANALTFSEISTNVNVFSKEAWILHRIEYYLPWAAQALLAGSADIIQIALTMTNSISTLDLSTAGVIDLWEIMRRDAGTPANAVFHENPYIRDFTTMPGGGIIIAPRPLYIACDSDSIASAATVNMRFYFERIELQADEYLELVDFYRIVS